MATPKKRVIRTPFNYVPDRGEVNEGPLLTMPDMSMSVQEIMHRFRSGRAVPESADLQYHGDQYLPDPRRLDLVEQEDLLRVARERVIALEEEVKTKQEQRSKALQSRRDKMQRLLDSAEKQDDTNSDKKDIQPGA